MTSVEPNNALIQFREKFAKDLNYADPKIIYLLLEKLKEEREREVEKEHED